MCNPLVLKGTYSGGEEKTVAAQAGGEWKEDWKMPLTEEKETGVCGLCFNENIT